MTRKKSTLAPHRPDGKQRGNKSEASAGRATGTGATSSTVGDAMQSWFAPAAVREVVESVVIAFVLAFLFRTFEAEAFVIPTGSMAPTLMGRHKDVYCEKCGFQFQASASSEVDPRSGNAVGHEVIGGTCPMCRYTMDFSLRNPQRKRYPSYTGDRILVGKFPYQFSDPERWDVAVFRFPGGATTNYIKRIVGLPRETVRIQHGDLWVQRDGEAEFVMARKSPAKILAVLQPVYDNDYVLPKIIQQGWPARWANDGTGVAAEGWTSDDYRSFRVGGTSREAWLRYRHFVPSAVEWQDFLNGTAPYAESIRPQLISDFCAYNTGIDTGLPSLGVERLGLHWVGDLALSAVLEVQSSSGEIVLELVKAGRRYQCTFDLAQGTAVLSINGQGEFHPTATTAVRGPGTYRVRFANMDRQLTLWVNDRVVPFDAPTTYDAADDVPQPTDLTPVGIASRGVQLRVDHLKVFRDLYYIATKEPMPNPMTDYDLSHRPLMTPEGIAQFLSDPAQWGAFAHRRSADFHLDADQFLALGDNSAQSRDSRLWGSEYYVKRDLLIGKALFIYWPHSWNEIPYVHVPFPFFPNFARMGLVR